MDKCDQAIRAKKKTVFSEVKESVLAKDRIWVGAGGNTFVCWGKKKGCHRRQQQ